ncbi:MAG: PQQ-binding-like beta-propeller repeat protein [Salinarchaeum sp.]
MAPNRWRQAVACLAVGVLFIVGGVGLASADEAPVEHAWTTSLEDSPLGTPVVGDDRVYVTTRRSLVALDAHTGQRRWSRSLSVPAAAPPVLVGGTVRVVDTTGTIHSFTAVTGAGNHSVRFGPTPPSYVTTSDDAVYLLTNETLRAVSVHDLTVRWERPVTASSLSIGSDTDVLVAASANGTIRGVDTQTGADQWTVSLPSPIVTPPAVRTDRVGVLTADGRVHALDADDGTTRWQVPLDISVIKAGTIVSQMSGFYVVPTSDTLVAIADGDIRWQRTLPTNQTQPAVRPTPGEVLVSTDTGHLLGIDASSGVDLWTASVATADLSPPAVGSAVYVGDSSGRLTAVVPRMLTLELTATRPSPTADTITVTATIKNQFSESLTRPVRIEAGGRTATVDQRLPPDEPVTVRFTGVAAFEPTVTVGPVRETLSLGADPRRSSPEEVPDDIGPSTTTVYIPDSSDESTPNGRTPGFDVYAAILAVVLFGGLARRRP